MMHALFLIALLLGSLWVAYACLRLAFGPHPHEPDASTPPRLSRHLVEIHRQEDEGNEPPPPPAEAPVAPRMH